MSTHVPSASTPTRPDPNAAVRRELARSRRPVQPMAFVMVFALIAVGAMGMGSLLSNPKNTLAASSSSQLVVQDTGSQFDWGAGWRLARTRSASGGTLHATGRAGATMTLVFYGTSVELLSPTGRAEGTMRVTLDGKTTIVSNHSTSYHAHQVVYSASAAGSTHTLTVKVTGSPGHPYIAIDAVVISGNQTLSPDWRGRNQRPHGATTTPPTSATPTPVLGDPGSTPTPTATPTPTGTPVPAPTTAPTPTPTAAPTQAPPQSGRPWSLPVTNQTVVVPASIDRTGATDVTASLNAFIASVPNGSVISFSPGTYRISAALDLRGKSNMIFEGNGATLNNVANANNSSSEPLSFFYTSAPGHSGAVSNHITIRDFVAKGASPSPGTYQTGEFAAFLTAYGGSYFEVTGITASGLFGDLATFNLNAQYIWVHDNHGISIGRNNVSIVWASHVLIEDNAFDRAGYCGFDIEPESASIGTTLTDITFRDNTLGRWSNTFVSSDGIAGTKVNDVTITGNTVTGGTLESIINLARRSNIVFTNNTSLVTGSGPLLQFAHIDGLTVTGNIQPLSRGSLASITDSTSVVSQ